MKTKDKRYLLRELDLQRMIMVDCFYRLAQVNCDKAEINLFDLANNRHQKALAQLAKE
jgi:hypothetical protein